MSDGPQVRVVGDGRGLGRRRATICCDGGRRPAAAPSRSTRCARPAGRRGPRPTSPAGPTRGRTRTRRPPPRRGARSPRGCAVRTGCPPGRARRSRAGGGARGHRRCPEPEPGQQVDPPTEPAEAEGHVGRAAAGVLRPGAVGAGDDVDQRLTDDERAIRGGRQSHRCLLVVRGGGVVTHRAQPLACAVEPLLAPGRERLAALPQARATPRGSPLRPRAGRRPGRARRAPARSRATATSAFGCALRVAVDGVWDGFGTRTVNQPRPTPLPRGGQLGVDDVVRRARRAATRMRSASPCATSCRVAHDVHRPRAAPRRSRGRASRRGTARAPARRARRPRRARARSAVSSERRALSRRASQPVLVLVDERRRLGEHRAAAPVVERVLLAVSRRGHRRARALPGLDEPGALLGDVRHDPLGGVGRGRGAQVRDEVEQRGVQVVPDRADQRRAARRRGAHERLVAERQQVLERAAAARDDDDLDPGVRVQLGDRRADLGDGARALHGHAADLELHGRPAARARWTPRRARRRPAGRRPGR